MELSRFFTLAEMIRSETAARENIPNEPAAEETAHLRALCTAILDPLRESLGQPISVNSGYRGPALNARIGGAKTSQHMEGKAADIQSSSLPVLELFKTVIRLRLPFDQLIYEAKNRSTKWVHVSHDPANSRGQIMVAQFGADGRASSYLPVSAQAALDLSEPASRSAIPVDLQYEELPDEPEFSTPRPKTRLERRRRKPAAKKSRPAGAARKKKAAPRKRSPARRKAVKRKAAKRVTRGRAGKRRGIRR